MEIAFIGVGNMGAPMALHLARAGHRLTLCDPRVANVAHRFAKHPVSIAGQPADAVRTADVIFTSLPSQVEVEEVALGPGGIIEGIQPGCIYVDLSTSSHELIRRIDSLFSSKGAQVLDAPVSGGLTGAEKGTLGLMVGGDPQTLSEVRPLLETFASAIVHAGPIGSGSIAKLVHNMVGICTRALLSEAFTLGVKAGLSPEALLEGLKAGAVGQGLLLHHLIPEIVFTGDFDHARFALRHSRKDIGLATSLAREHNVPTLIASLVEQEMIQGMVRGWGDKDSVSAFMLQEERAGVRVRVGAYHPDHSRPLPPAGNDVPLDHGKTDDRQAP
ncbi:NAD(P)-dependent oxidoreductase [Streptomyces sp. NPDC005500]|uniref:NAD(P)-dependent oxidoreductase n=1 Tax=Streptomyces sp. NPDC005500 TaxID=3155007 RepID=UPI0033AF6187